MFMPVQHYHIEGLSKESVVIAETTTKKECEQEIRRRNLADSCQVYKEQGHQIYRAICRTEEVVAEWK